MASAVAPPAGRLNPPMPQRRGTAVPKRTGVTTYGHDVCRRSPSYQVTQKLCTPVRVWRHDADARPADVESGPRFVVTIPLYFYGGGVDRVNLRVAAGGWRGAQQEPRRRAVDLVWNRAIVCYTL